MLRHPRAGLRRLALWGTCLSLVIAGHAAFFLELSHRSKTQGELPTPPAVMIDLTPLPAPPTPAAPPPPAPAAKPQPAQQIAKTAPVPPPKVPTPVRPITPPVPTPPTPVPPAPTPPQPSPNVQTPPPPITPPVVQPPLPLDLPVAESDAALPMPPPPPPAAPALRRKKQPLLRKLVAAPPPPATELTQQTPKAVAAPTPSTSPATDTDTRAPAQQAAVSGQTRQDWQSRLLAHIAQYKNYPAEAQENGWQGMSIVRFTFTRAGVVTSAVLVQSSGHADLDAAAIATLHRASPLPPPPASIPGDPITLTLPLQFSLDQN